MIVRARTVLPISKAPISDGAVQILGNRIGAVAPWSRLKNLSEPVIDLGEVVLLPGLVNAHCHLDYTDMAGMISPTKSFSSWIKAILALKSQWSYSEFAQSWINGAKMLARTGTTTVLDIEAVPELLPEVWAATPLRVLSLLELTGVKSRRPATEIVAEATQRLHTLQHPRHRVGLSPHAPYSTSHHLLKRTAEIAQEQDWLVSTHVAESVEEIEMFEHKRGALHDWLRSQRDMSDLGKTPVRLLEQAGLLSDRFIAVHGNYVSAEDASLLAKRGSSVVHCPGSHAYFGHETFPYQHFEKAGVNIALGTDSLASMVCERGEQVELNLFTEMQRFSKSFPNVTPEKIVRMGTVNGANALGLRGLIGELKKGAAADLIAVPASAADDPWESVVHASAPSSVMGDGTWLSGPP